MARHIKYSSVRQDYRLVYSWVRYHLWLRAPVFAECIAALKVVDKTYSSALFDVTNRKVYDTKIAIA